MADDAVITEFGGVALTASSNTVSLQARNYTHPSLAGRTVVRLVPTSLAEVEDLSLGVLGFQPGGQREVGHVRDQAIGFPAWPIITDPANARHALNLVADLHRVDKLAKSKPGQAKEMLDGLAKPLGQSAPHFLPTFLEEGARIFLRHDGRRYASQFFSKAREAERVHNLAIDEDRHRKVLLEFALAGALSAKEISNEAKALLNRHDPGEALELFLKLNIDRVLGGMPPYSGLEADLRRLIKAAKADATAVFEQLLVAIIAAPALARAPKSFWTAITPAFISLVGTNPQIRTALVQLTPQAVDPDTWVELLEATGIVSDLLAGHIDARDWVERFICSLQRRWDPGYPRKLASLIRSLDMLRDTEITLLPRIWALEPELLDALLAVGAKVKIDKPHRYMRMKIDGWLNEPERCPLNFLAESEYASWLMSAIGQAVPKHLDTLLAYPGTVKLLDDWAKTRLGEEPTLSELQNEFRRLIPLFSPAGIRAFPSQTAELASRFDPAVILAGVLRDGLITEYTWPALEEAAAELGGQVNFHASWPAIGVSANGRIIWVAGQDRLAEATFTPAGGQQPERWDYLLVAGATLCKWLDGEHNSWLTWSDNPGTSHQTVPHWGNHYLQSFPVDQGRLVGAHLVRRGDSTDPFTHQAQLLGDGNGYWVCDQEKINEVDPATGHKGRAALPGALAEMLEPYLRQGWQLTTTQHLTWAPSLSPAGDSPLPAVNGQLGWIRLDRGGSRIFLDNDGYSHQAESTNYYDLPIARLRRPGGGHWLLANNRRLCRDSSTADLLTLQDCWEQPHLLYQVPKMGWDYFRVRDQAASARLRQVSPADLGELVELVPPLKSTTLTGLFNQDTADLLADEQARAGAARLLGSTDPVLIDSVIWASAYVKQLVNQALSHFTVIDQDEISFAGWEPSAATLSWVYARCQATSRSAIRGLADQLAGKNVKVGGLNFDLTISLTRPEILLAGASHPAADNKLIGETAAAIGSVLDAGLYQPNGCIFKVANPKDPAVRIEPGQLIDTASSKAIALGRGIYTGWAPTKTQFFSPTGEVPARVGEEATQVWLKASKLSPKELKAACQHLLDFGPPAWDETKVTRLAEGLGWPRAAAAIFMAGMPCFSSYKNNYLPKELREILGLKVGEASEARIFLKDIDITTRLELLSAGAQDPLRLVREGLDVAAMIDFWQQNYRSDVIFDAALLKAADQAFPYRGAIRLRELSEKATAESVEVWLWLAAQLDRADPLAPWLAGRLADIRLACAEATKQWQDYSGGPELRQILGLPARNKSTAIGEVHTSGAWSIRAERSWDVISWDPAAVSDWAAETKLAESLPDTLWFSNEIRACIAVLSGALKPIEQDLRTGVAGIPQDPAVSAPSLVDEVAQALNLSAASARYWLQILALHNPTDKNIETWNGWTKTERRKAAAELVARELVIEAKRARAGRSLFLTGGWLEATSPHLPMEVWKVPFYDLRDSGKVNPRQNVVVPLVPLGQLFADAWQRYRDGDIPGYTELRTQRYRRR